MPLIEAIEALNASQQHEIAINPFHRDGHVTAAFPGSSNMEIVVGDGIGPPTVTSVGVAVVAAHARTALVPALALLDVALARIEQLEPAKDRRDDGERISLQAALHAFNDAQQEIVLSPHRSGQVVGTLPRSGQQAVVETFDGEIGVRALALVAGEARLVLAPALALLDAALGVLAQLDLPDVESAAAK